MFAYTNLIRKYKLYGQTICVKHPPDLFLKKIVFPCKTMGMQDQQKPSVHMPTQRVISLLEALADAEHGFTLTQLAQYIGSSKGTISPILETLQQHDFVRRDKLSGRYELGRGLYLFSEGFRTQDPLMAQAQACMRQVVDACAEICQLGILSHTEVLYIAKVDSREPIQIISRVGSRMPARKTALGKALLSQCKREEVVALFAGELCTEPFDMDAFLEELQKVRQGSIARDIGEINPQLHCYAVPVTFAGRVDCAMSVSLPAFRDTPEKHQQVESELRNAVAKLEQFMNETHECFCP